MSTEPPQDFSDEEKALIASTPSKPVFSAEAEPMARSFHDRMQSSLSDPVDHRLPKPAEPARTEASVEDAEIIFRV